MNYCQAAGLALLVATISPAQDVISARSGLLHYTEGVVTINGKPVERKAAEFPAMKQGEELRTETGRAEILLMPGVFLRVSEDSGLRLVKNDLSDTQLEVLSGSVLLEVGDIDKTQSLTVSVGQTAMEFTKRGLFRIDFDPARISVFDGSAVVVSGNQPVTVKEGRQAALGGVVNPEKFNKESTDAFHRWAGRRSGYIAAANIVAARRVHDGVVPWQVSNWMYNPYFGMFTYLPVNGLYRNPFGYSFYSPLTIQRVYYRPDPIPFDPNLGGGGGPGFGGRGGPSDMGGRSMGSYSGGGGMSAPAAPSGPAAPAAGGRGAGGGGSRSTGGGR